MEPASHWRHKSRPVNLNLTTIRFPVSAIVSILHRISGVILFIFIPFLLWAFSRSLASPDEFAAVHAVFASTAAKFFLWAFFSALLYHMLAGVRHLVADIGYGETKSGLAGTGWIVIILAVIGAVLLGAWLW